MTWVQKVLVSAGSVVILGFALYLWVLFFDLMDWLRPVVHDLF